MIRHFSSVVRTVAVPLLMVLCMFIGLSTRAHGQGSVCAEGGGSIARDEWAKPAFEWMVRQARVLAEKDGGPVRVVILGSMDEGTVSDAPGVSEPEQVGDRVVERFKEAGAAEVRSLYVNGSNARAEDVAAALRGAHIVWMRGGSQSRYCEFWKGTPVEQGIRAVFDRGGVVGGTSAGCAVLGEVIYDAAGGSCDAGTALRDAHAKEISFTTGFLGLTPGVLFDTHFTERARIARLAVFLGRIRQDLGRDVLGIGMDTRTALCIGPDGRGEVFGTGAACIMRLTPESRIVLPAAWPEEPEAPAARGGLRDWPASPTLTDIAVRQIVAGERVNIRELVAELVSPDKIKEHAAPKATEPQTTRSQIDPKTNRFIRGDATAHAERGMHFIDPALPKDALFDGALKLSAGTNEVPGTVVAVRSLSLKDRTQNAAGGVLWALATTEARWGAFLDMAAGLRLTDAGTVESYFPFGKLGSPMSAPVFVKSATFKAGPMPVRADGQAVRQTASFDGLRMHVLGAGWGFDPETGASLPRQR